MKKEWRKKKKDGNKLPCQLIWKCLLWNSQRLRPIEQPCDQSGCQQNTLHSRIPCIDHSKNSPLVADGNDSEASELKRWHIFLPWSSAHHPRRRTRVGQWSWSSGGVSCSQHKRTDHNLCSTPRHHTLHRSRTWSHLDSIQQRKRRRQSGRGERKWNSLAAGSMIWGRFPLD